MPILTKGNPLFTSPSNNLSPEQDALRWRGLMERVQRLEQMMGKTVKFGQVGAPGGSDIIAQRLRDGSSRFLIDLGNTLATVRDTNNTIRAQMGNLPTNGISPAQYGFRANDATGAPIFDSQGLIATVTIAGSAINFSQQSVTGNGAFQTVSGSSVTVNPSRPVNVLALGSGTYLDPTVGDTAFVMSCGILLDGAFNNANGPEIFNADGIAKPVTPLAVITSLSATSHTFAVGAKQTSGKLWSMIQGFLYVLFLGA